MLVFIYFKITIKKFKVSLYERRENLKENFTSATFIIINLID